jgi:hypothetical protein
LNCVTEARLSRLKRDALRNRERELYRQNKEKNLVKFSIWTHKDDVQALKDFAADLRSKRKL